MLSTKTWSARAMGTTVVVSAVAAPEGAARWVRHELQRLEQCWSRFRPDSELCALNRSAGAGPVMASAELRGAVERALRLWRATDGNFDPTVLAALERLGYDRTFTQVRARRGERSATAWVPAPVPGPVGVVVDDETGTISLPAGVRLDLGGVGKGLTADHLARGLVALGAAGACVSVGGDVATAGQPAGPTWLVAVEDPFVDGLERWRVPLTSGAVTQSSRLMRRWRADGEERHHLVDPRTGRPADTGIAAVVVVADEAWWAEGVAKAALVAGPVEGCRMIGRLCRGGWLVRTDGTVTLAGGVQVRGAA